MDVDGTCGQRTYCSLAVTRDNARARPAPVAPGLRSVEVRVDSNHESRVNTEQEHGVSNAQYSTVRVEAVALPPLSVFFTVHLCINLSPSSSSSSSPGTTISSPCPTTHLYQLSHQRITKILSRLIFSISSICLCLLVALQKRKVSQFAEYALSLPALSSPKLSPTGIEVHVKKHPEHPWTV